MTHPFTCEYDAHGPTVVPAVFRMAQTDTDEPGADSTYACAKCADAQGWIGILPDVHTL